MIDFLKTKVDLISLKAYAEEAIEAIDGLKKMCNKESLAIASGRGPTVKRNIIGAIREGNKDHIYQCLGEIKNIVAELMKDGDCFDKFIPKKYWKGERGEFICPDCGEEAPNDGYWPSPFCPGCGTKLCNPEDK